jgi:hypothetical protein
MEMMRAVCVANDPQQSSTLSADGAWREANLALWFFARQIQTQVAGAHLRTRKCCASPRDEPECPVAPVSVPMIRPGQWEV